MNATTLDVTESAHIWHTSLTYRLVVNFARMRKRAVALVLTALLVGALTASGSEADPTVARLKLDGVPLHPELALTYASRGRGLMGRRKAPKDGMLFVFRDNTTASFWMKNTLVPLTIVFFDARGRQVLRLSMTPCRRDPCRTYDPGRAYRFALELPASDRRPAKRLGPLWELRRLSHIAS